MLSAQDRRGNPLFTMIPNAVLTPDRFALIGPAWRVFLVLSARAYGDGSVDAGAPVALAGLAADAGLPVETVRKHVRRLVAAGVLIERHGYGKWPAFVLSTGFHHERSGAVKIHRTTPVKIHRTRSDKALSVNHLTIPLDVKTLDVKDKRVTASPSAAFRKRFRTEPNPPPEPAPRTPPLPWVRAVYAGMHGTAGRREDVVRAVRGAVSLYLDENPRTPDEALTRAVAQYCRSIVDKGLFPGVSPWAYLPKVIAAKADAVLEERLEAEAAGRRDALARERRRTG